MSPISRELVHIALENVTGSDFELFFQAFYPAVSGVDFVPLGGQHDGGADAFQDESLFQGLLKKATSFYQASTQEDYRSKIRNTVHRLRDFDRVPKSLLYVTSRTVKYIDECEEDLSNELDVFIKIRDREWITSNVNRSHQTAAAFSNHLEKYLEHLNTVGGATTISNSPHIPARTLCVFLGQEVERRRGNTDLLEAVTDSLILWALEGTDPDEDRLMSRSDIMNKIDEVLPSARHIISGTFDHRIQRLASKGNRSGREVRWHKQRDMFCLPYETREIVKQENIDDEALKLKVLALYEERAEVRLGDSDNLSPGTMAWIVHRALELTFEQQGLDLAEFLVEADLQSTRLVVSDRVDEAIIERGLGGEEGIRARQIALSILRQAFYNSQEFERLYYGKLSRTYSLMFSLRNEPKITEYFKGMSSKFILLVGSDIIVRALSERYLCDEDQMTVNMLRILRDAGATLVLTHMTVEEVHAHVKASDREFGSWYEHMEPYVDDEIASQINKILIRAYFHAKFDPLISPKPAGWKSFIEQVCSYKDLYQDVLSRNQVKGYLVEKFGMEYLADTEVSELVRHNEVEDLTSQIKTIKFEEILARNDARHILAVYGKREGLSEGHRPNPYGYRTWWLTHEARVRQCTNDLVRAKGAHYLMSPEFIVNFIALSPSTEAVRESYQNVFPTLLGVKMSNRIRDEVLHDLMGKAKEVREVDEARAKVMMADLSNKLKSGRFKNADGEMV